MRKKINLVGLVLVILAITFYSFNRVSPGSGASKGILPLHFIAYSVLAAAFLLNLQGRSRRHLEAFLLAIVFGSVIELMQLNLSYRFFSWRDVFVNSLGGGTVMFDYRLEMNKYVVSFQDRIIEAFLGKAGL